MQILNMAHFLPSTGVGDESRVQYKQTCHALDEFIRKCFTEWTCSLDNVIYYCFFYFYQFNNCNTFFFNRIRLNC